MHPSARATWLGRVTTWLLTGSAGVVAGAATPALLRAGGVEIPVAAAPSSAAPLALPQPPPEIKNPMPDTGLDAEEEEALLEPHGQLGQTRKPLVLHEKPAAASAVMGKVDAGELVSILRIAGDWALVYYGGGGSLVAGWAKKSEIAIR